jgi:hypothetical protein
MQWKRGGLQNRGGGNFSVYFAVPAVLSHPEIRVHAGEHPLAKNGRPLQHPLRSSIL